MDINKNTLLAAKSLPEFSKIRTKDMYQAINYLIKENKKIIKNIEKYKKTLLEKFRI
jgi:Zn-dependent oligopeptidase